MSHGRQRHRLFIIGSVIIVLATALLLFFAREKGFTVGGVPIRPNALVRQDETYEIMLWEEEIIIPWAAKTQSEMLIDAVRQFQQLRPNAAITYTIVEPGEGRRQLAASIAAGAPPDVYGTSRGVVYYPQLQVPATPYLPLLVVDHPEFFSAAAVALLSDEQHMWGWPSGLWWHGWLRRKGEGETVWSAPGLAVNALDVAFFEQLMAAAGVPAYIDADGTPLWDEATVAHVAAFVRKAQKEGLFSGNINETARTRLASLFAGDATIIAPVGPHLVQTIFRRNPQEYTLAAPPRVGTKLVHAGDAAIPLDVSGYFVFRHDPYAGDDHTRVAVELAAFLANFTQRWLIESLALIPADKQGEDLFRSAPLDEQSKRVLLGYTDGKHTPYTINNSVHAATMREAVKPHWEAFWLQSLSPEQFAALVTEELHRRLSTNGGQN